MPATSPATPTIGVSTHRATERYILDMPLTERPGVFRARLNDARGWYVVHPDRDARAGEDAWKAHAATTNRSTAARILGATVGWGVFLVVFGAVMVLSASFANSLGLGWLSGLGVFAALGVASCAAFAFLAITPSPPHRTSPVTEVREVPRDIVARVDADVSRRALWELSVAHGALGDAAIDAVWETLERDDWARSEPAEVTLDRLSPAVRDEWEGAVATFERTASEHGLPVRQREVELASYMD